MIQGDHFSVVQIQDCYSHFYNSHSDDTQAEGGRHSDELVVAVRNSDAAQGAMVRHSDEQVVAVPHFHVVAVVHHFDT